LKKLATERQKKANAGVDYKKKLQRKIEWSKAELKTLIKLNQRSNTDVHKWYGSSSGAFGICQFIPSSYLNWAVDGDGSGYINLFAEADAIPSVANYLSSHGWVLGLKNKVNRDAVFAYNRSQIYVDTILKVARTLSSAGR
jgi:membrane-bound lytic murein transglycosylase B